LIRYGSFYTGFLGTFPCDMSPRKSIAITTASMAALQYGSDNYRASAMLWNFGKNGRANANRPGLNPACSAALLEAGA
jgi:hypothetical protein